MKKTLTLLILTALLPGAAFGATLPCSVCAGVRVDDPAGIAAAIAGASRLGDDDVLFVSWTVPLDGTADPALAAEIRAAGAKPWIRAEFRTPQPISGHLDRFERELASIARLVRDAGGDLVVQAVWRPESGGSPDPEDHAFLLKKAAVAVTGASADARFVAGPLTADPARLRALYAEEIAAYLDLVALAPDDDLLAAIAVLTELDPGKPVVLDALTWPEDPTTTLVEVAEASAAGVAVTFFDAGPADVIDLEPLKILARELRGDLVFDPYSTPSGAPAAWSFVREDLGLRVIAAPAAHEEQLQLSFADSQLRAATRVDVTTGAVYAVPDQRRTAQGYSVTVDDPGSVVLLRLERPSAAELAGFENELEVDADREIPVEEILRRLQAFEDDQARRLLHYQARRTLHLRFQAVRGAFEAAYSGDFFFRRDHGFDWEWRDFYVGGIKWRSKKLPKVPLIQPEKVASLPAEIRLHKDYDYRLRGTQIIGGRDCWVIDFKPVEVVPGKSLYRGTVWVDRERFARVRTRATQIGLEGSVLSNEEVFHFTPLDADGGPAPWSEASFVLPLEITGQQTMSLLSVTLPVEVETVLTDLRINGEAFDRNREAALASDSTMLRDTDDGLRYLRKDEDGVRHVETKTDSTRLFLLGGVFWDESVDYPLPLAGVSYLDLDVKETGAQFAVFFAGAILNAGYSDPNLFGSRFNGGANLDGLFFKAKDELYRDGEIVPGEDVKSRNAAGDLFIGRPLAKFLSFELTYRLRQDDYSRADDTADDFVLPMDTLTQTLRARIEYNRLGYRLRLAGDTNRRSDWGFWGLPGNDEYDPGQKDYQRWQITFGKTWWLPKFRKIGLTLEHLDGSNLDRFSGYDFGIFGRSPVAGYQSGLVRAEKVDGAHLSVGVNYFDQIRFEVKGDAVWASNAMTGLDNELLGGIGIGGTLTLPWQLIMNFEAGYAVAGPGKGNIALRVFFLRLFPGQ